MKKYLFSIAAVALLSLCHTDALMAQDKTEKAKEKNKLGEYDEIIIKQKDVDKNGKVIIEINDGEVIVNGKAIDDFDDDNITVRRRGASRYKMATPGSPFRTSTNAWTLEGEGRPLLGVNSEDAEGGAKIVNVSENSAAEKAGLKKGDVIIAINDKKITSPDDLSRSISSYKPDEKVTVTYKRDNKENKATATLGKQSMIFGNNNFVFEDFDLNLDVPGAASERVFYAMGRPRLGIRAQDTEDGNGVKVLSVDKGSVAEKAGVKENDVITEFEGKKVTSADELLEASRAARQKNEMNLKLNRDGKSQTLELKIPKKLKTANL